MKITKDVIDNLYVLKNGTIRYNRQYYVLVDACKVCGCIYLTRKNKQSVFCSYSCRSTGKYNNFYGKKHTDKTKKIISTAHVGKKHNVSESVRKTCGKRFAIYNKTKHPNYKKDVYKLELALYTTYSDVLKRDGVFVRPYDMLIANILYKIIEVKCYHCGKWYIPDRSSVKHRVQKINGSKNDSKCNFYCSEECKHVCYEYGRTRNPTISKFEEEIYNFVVSVFNGHIVRNDRMQIVNPNTGHNLELDIWLPEIKKAIECNGVYWHSKQDRAKLDNIKKRVCKQNCIDLLVIFDNDWYSNKDKYKNNIKNFLEK